jgi:hypothetical protein
VVCFFSHLTSPYLGPFTNKAKVNHRSGSWTCVHARTHPATPAHWVAEAELSPSHRATRLEALMFETGIQQDDFGKYARIVEEGVFLARTWEESGG